MPTVLAQPGVAGRVTPAWFWGASGPSLRLSLGLHGALTLDSRSLRCGSPVCLSGPGLGEHWVACRDDRLVLPCPRAAWYVTEPGGGSVCPVARLGESATGVA